MNKKKIQALVVAGLIATNTMTPLADTLVQVEENKKVGVESRVDSVVRAGVNQVYLSDIDYDKSASKVQYGSIAKDTTHNGNSITLIVDGEVKEFEKGMGAHATSTLVYDISAHKNNYTRLVTYAGIDSRQGGNGNGARFEIYTSVDGQEWELVENLGVLKGNNEAGYVDIRLGDANFIKLYADNNGGNGNDHAVWGDTKLVTDDYSLAGVPVTGLETLESYDATLKANDVDYNIEHNEMTILRRALIKRIGYESIQRIAAQDVIYSEGINFLMSDTTALKYFMTGGPVNSGGSYKKSLKSFCEIYAEHKDELRNPADDNFNLRLAISIALSYSRKETVSAWIMSNQEPNPIHRYEVYQHLIASGKMDKNANSNNHKQWSSAEFKALPIPMMRWTVDARMNDDEILWLADYALKEKEAGKNEFDAYNYIEYITDHSYTRPQYYDEDNREYYNDIYGFEDYFSDYGDTSIARLWMAFEDGGVCGALAQTYSNLADVFGRPSSPCGQPGHAASATYQWNSTNGRYEWVLQNNISGWTQSGNQYDDRMLGWGDDWSSWSIWYNASYTVLASDAVMYDYDNYVKATMLNLLAEIYDDNSEIKREIYSKALEYQKINLDSMEGIINAYKADSDTSAEEYFELAKKIIDAYTYYPQAMMELLALIQSNITEPSYSAQIDLLKHNALLKASNATPDVSTNVTMAKEMAGKYLGNESTELATFSFDGENANKIVINSKYEGTDIRVRYSLDGGANWTESNNHVITLSKEELDSITAEDDIRVGLVGINDVYVIDILPGKTITQSIVHSNDNENLLLGDVNNLEFSLDGGTTWCDYVTTEEDNINPNNVTGIRFEGNKNVKIRYKAYGLYLQSKEVEYTFTENTDSETKKYVQLKNIKFIESSAYQNGHKPEQFIDGNLENGFHTPYNSIIEDKFYTVEFDKPRYINSIEYVFAGGNNGRIKNGEILASLDGKEWIVVKEIKDNPRDKANVEFEFDNVVKAKFIKIVATETHGNGSGETNKYFSGKELRFYEDTTIVEDTPEVLPPTEEQPPVDDNIPEEEEPPTEEQPPIEDNNPEEEQPPVMPPVDTPELPEEEPEQPEQPEIPEEEVPEDSTDTPTIPPVDSEEVPGGGSDNETEINPEQPPVEDEETPDTEVPPTEEPEIEEPSKPEVDNPEEEKPEFNHSIVELVSGNGQNDNPLELIIKESVMVNELNSFLTELKMLNPILISKTIEGNYTVYELKLDRNSELLDKIFRTRNVDDSVYAIIKVENSRTELVSVLNDFVKETNSSVLVPETPSTQAPEANTESKPNDSETIKDETSSSTNDSTINNINSGDATRLGSYLLLGAISLLGALGLLKKRNKK